MIIQELIGRKFKRNKYGLSLWEDTVQGVFIHLELVKPPEKIPKSKFVDMKDWFREHVARIKRAQQEGYKIQVMVTGFNTKNSFNIEEIIIY